MTSKPIILDNDLLEDEINKERLWLKCLIIAIVIMILSLCVIFILNQYKYLF